MLQGRLAVSRYILVKCVLAGAQIPQQRNRSRENHMKPQQDADSREDFESLDKSSRRLPSPVLELAALPGLDDGLIVRVEYDRTDGALTLAMRCGYVQIGYFDLLLQYMNPHITPENETLLARLARSTVNCGDFDADLSQHEIDATDDGGLEHRLAFHVFRREDVWITIRCASMEWHIVQRDSRALPDMQDRFPGGPETEYGRLSSSELSPSVKN